MSHLSSLVVEAYFILSSWYGQSVAVFFLQIGLMLGLTTLMLGLTTLMLGLTTLFSTDDLGIE